MVDEDREGSVGKVAGRLPQDLERQAGSGSELQLEDCEIISSRVRLTMMGSKFKGNYPKHTGSPRGQ